MAYSNRLAGRRAIMPHIPIVGQFHCLLLFMFVLTCMPELKGKKIRTPILGLKLGLLAPTKAHSVCLLLLSRYELFPFLTVPSCLFQEALRSLQ